MTVCTFTEIHRLGNGTSAARFDGYAARDWRWIILIESDGQYQVHHIPPHKKNLTRDNTWVSVYIYIYHITNVHFLAFTNPPESLSFVPDTHGIDPSRQLPIWCAIVLWLKLILQGCHGRGSWTRWGPTLDLSTVQPMPERVSCDV